MIFKTFHFRSNWSHFLPQQCLCFLFSSSTDSTHCPGTSLVLSLQPMGHPVAPHSASATEDSAVSPEARRLLSDSWHAQRPTFETTCSTHTHTKKATFLYHFTSHLSFLGRPKSTQNLVGRACDMRVPYLQSHHNVLYILCLN